MFRDRTEAILFRPKKYQYTSLVQSDLVRCDPMQSDAVISHTALDLPVAENPLLTNKSTNCTTKIVQHETRKKLRTDKLPVINLIKLLYEF